MTNMALEFPNGAGQNAWKVKFWADHNPLTPAAQDLCSNIIVNGSEVVEASSPRRAVTCFSCGVWTTVMLYSISMLEKIHKRIFQQQHG